MLKILQARLQQYMNWELPDVKAQDVKLRCKILKRIPEKTSVSLAILKPFSVWITTNCGKFLMWWEYQTTLPASWETSMQVKKPQLELDIEKEAGSNWERSMSRLYIVTSD